MKGQHWVLSKYILNNAADERVALFSLYVYTNALNVLTALHSVYNAVYGIAALCYLYIDNAVDIDSVYVCI